MLGTIILMFLISATHWILQVYSIPTNFSSTQNGFTVVIDLNPTQQTILMVNVSS